MTQHSGLLSFISEANEIRQAEGVSADEAFRLQRERARMREASNVVYVDFGKGKT